MPKSKCIRNPVHVIGPSIAYIPLTKGQWTLVDAESIALVAGVNWHSQWNPRLNGFYAVRNQSSNGKRGTVLMHRVILDAPNGMFVDHRSGATLNNMRMNLRLATPVQSAANRRVYANNSSGHVGVKKQWKGWTARIMAGNKEIYLGTFSSLEDAISARESAAKRFHGEFQRAI